MLPNMWWGYLHSNGTIQVKRWWGNRADYTTDCENSPFVVSVVQPFEANSREDAMQIARAHLFPIPHIIPKHQ
jgi:hypothetical protein